MEMQPSIISIEKAARATLESIQKVGSASTLKARALTSDPNSEYIVIIVMIV